MSPMPTPLFTFDEFLAWELRYPDEKWELIDGVIYAMAGGTTRHSAVAMRLGSLLLGAADAHGCSVYGSDLLVRLSDFGGVYPDLCVVCGEVDPHATHVRNPCLVVEVLSPSTRSYDTKRKREMYLAVPTVKQYLVVDPYAPAIHEWRTANAEPTTHMLGDTITLDCPSMNLDVSAVFA